MSAAALFALAAVLLVTAESAAQCASGKCEDNDDVSYMHLLQVHADSRRSEASEGIAIGRRVNGSSRAMKTFYPFYHTSSELKEQANLLSQGCGGAMKMETISEGGVDIDVVHVRAPKSEPENKVFILFGEHCRELIGPESALRLLEVLCGKVDSGAGLDLQSLLQDSEFQFVLNGNPRGREQVEQGQYCLRTNPNGVDLNRNWDEQWSAGDSMGSQTNAGPEPFSEPETKIFKRLVEAYRPTTFLTVHSGTKGMYMPWAYDMQHTAQYNAPLMLSLLKDLDKTHCQCPFGAAGKEVGYPCPGTCLDWVYSKLRTPYVFAFEIYTSDDRSEGLRQRWEQLRNRGMNLLETGGHLGHEHFSDLFSEYSSDFVQRRRSENDEEDETGCFNMFNPRTEHDYEATVQNWAVAYLEMAARIAKDIKDKKIDES